MLPGEKTGKCVIISPEANGQTVVEPGANLKFTREMYDAALSDGRYVDWLVCQNEIHDVSYPIQLAKSKSMRVLFKPSPIPPTCSMKEWRVEYPADLLVLNRKKGAAIFRHWGIQAHQPGQALGGGADHEQDYPWDPRESYCSVAWG